MMAWRTLLDAFNEVGEVPDGIEVIEPPLGSEIPYVRCKARPGCDRGVPADMMYELDGAFMCDGCVEIVRVKEGLSRRDMTARLGGHRRDSPRPTRPYHRGRKALDVQ